jgi:ABC-type hemin transport system substrate-binding protein
MKQNPIDEVLTKLRITQVWLNNLRDEKDIQDAMNKIDEVIQILGKIN